MRSIALLQGTTEDGERAYRCRTRLEKASIVLQTVLPPNDKAAGVRLVD